MRRPFLIPVIILSMQIRLFSQPVISVNCDNSWGPGRYNKVTVTIGSTGAGDFARFSQDFPVGVKVRIDDAGSGDFNWVSNQLNIVWMKLPENRILRFSYFAITDKEMSGRFAMTGKFSIVAEGGLKTTLMDDIPVSIEGLNGILPDQMKTVTAEVDDHRLMKNIDNKPDTGTDDIIFRVQVSVSSKRISEKELTKKLGLESGSEASIVSAGKMFKYQAGSFSSYDAAGILLKEIVERGYKDAFIVAYRNGGQISVEKALELLK